MLSDNDDDFFRSVKRKEPVWGYKTNNKLARRRC